MVLRSFAIICLVLLSSCSDTEAEEQEITISEEQERADGELLYLNNCASCHGLDGKAGVSNAKDLSDSKLEAEQLKQVILEGRNSMPPFEHILSGEGELEAVVDHVTSLKKKK